MEYNHYEADQSINSSQEVDQPEQGASDILGIGRSYECVFCKRGFTTAQALGGHMNIHRKDRARNSRPSDSVNNNSNKHEENCYVAGPRSYHPMFSSYPPHYSAAQETQVHYRTYFPAASTSNGTPSFFYESNHNDNPQQQQAISLSLQFDARDMEKIRKRHGGSEENELDLELRLGHDP
ncbi:hypothetical protein RJ639_031466 [Escallonia herrerae]|uniref:C2H2-type domain-containing protein n=1 Tax=Escallonia herrerae TaxID=1293975 RepID=A0AA88X4R1_9ASTE|nr:hypothetical protein RJ639_031466 [Escallonia herrerae]